MRIIRLVIALAVVVVVSHPRFLPLAAQSPEPQAPEQTQDDSVRIRAAARNNIYIVRMTDVPAGSYTGGVAGLPATKAPRGQKLDPDSPAVVGYGAFLRGRHDEALARVGGGRKVYDYQYSLNGFAAELSEAQADALRSTPGVVAVTRDELLSQDTVSTPAFLGLRDPGGLWEQVGGIGAAGEEMIIGIIDSGIWPEHPSFSDRTRHQPERQSGRQALIPPDSRLARQMYAGRGIPGLEVQPEDHMASVIRRRMLPRRMRKQPGVR